MCENNIQLVREGLSKLTESMLERNPTMTMQEMKAYFLQVCPDFATDRYFQELFPTIYQICSIKQLMSDK